MPIVKTDQTLECVDCGEKIPPYDPAKDTERPMRGRDGQIRCECCYEDYVESYQTD